MTSSENILPHSIVRTFFLHQYPDDFEAIPKIVVVCMKGKIRPRPNDEGLIGQMIYKHDTGV
jgi:hypothetical protein